MPAMKPLDRPFKRNSDTELDTLVRRCERTLQAGTSSHADMVSLVEAEREIMYREAKKLRQTMHEERQARTLSSGASGTGGNWLAVGPEASAARGGSGSRDSLNARPPLSGRPAR